MTAAGLGLNKYCYDGLITAFKNREPVTEETTSKIMELVKQSKGWSSVEASSGSEDSGMIGVTEEELHNIPTAEIVQRRYINRRLTVYHTALHACADLGSKEAVETISEMLKQDGYAPDLLCDTSNAVLPTMQEIYGADGYFSKVKEWVNQMQAPPYSSPSH